MRGRVVISNGHVLPLVGGSPWVFKSSIDWKESVIQDGEHVVDVFDTRSNWLFSGFFNPVSLITVRKVADLNVHTELDASFVQKKLEDARQLRERLLDADSNAFRLLNAEGDGIGGLTVDIFNDLATVQFTSFAARESIGQFVFDHMKKTYRCVVELPAGKGADSNLPSVSRIVGGDSSTVEFVENGTKFLLNAMGGQKSGAFLDQRVNRGLVKKLSRGAKVLDLFCYHGGFGLASAVGGAKEVFLVDSSAKAIECVRENAKLNGLSVTAVCQDATEFLRDNKQEFDMVVVDPPKFAPSAKDLPAAIRGYTTLNARAMRAVRHGGFFASSSCSSAVDSLTFERVLAQAAAQSKRRIRLLVSSGAGPDHPLIAGFEKTRYLKFVLCKMD